MVRAQYIQGRVYTSDSTLLHVHCCAITSLLSTSETLKHIPEGQSSAQKLACMKGVGIYTPPMSHSSVPVRQYSVNEGKGHTYQVMGINNP